MNNFNNAEDFKKDLLKAPETKQPTEKELSNIYKLSTTNYSVLAQLIPICLKITDEEMSTYIDFVNTSLSNVQEYKHIRSMLEAIKGQHLTNDFI